MSRSFAGDRTLAGRSAARRLLRSRHLELRQLWSWCPLVRFPDRPLSWLHLQVANSLVFHPGAHRPSGVIVEAAVTLGSCDPSRSTVGRAAQIGHRP